MNRIDIINSLIQKNGYNSYCEIGVAGGECFQAIVCENKTSVDPEPLSASVLKMTSDHFFENFEQLNPANFDIYFIDGLHHADQVLKDINNALNHLKPGGTIVCHDMLPINEKMQTIPIGDNVEWTGDCWKAWVELRKTRSDLFMNVVNTDWGCGIISKRDEPNPHLLQTDLELNYANFVQNQQEWMNVISVEYFQVLYLRTLYI